MSMRTRLGRRLQGDWVMEGVADDVRLELGVMLPVGELDGVLLGVLLAVLVPLAVWPEDRVDVWVGVPVPEEEGVSLPVWDALAVWLGLGVWLVVGVLVGVGLGSNSVTG